MKTPRALAGSTRSSSPSLPNSAHYWIGMLISLTYGSRVDAPRHQTAEILCDLILFRAPFPRLRTFRPHGETPEALRAAKASIPWSSSSAAAVSAPRTADRLKGLVELHREMEVGCAGWSLSVPTTSPRRTNIVAASALTGPSSQTRGVSSKKISTSLNTRILPTIR